MSIHIYAVCLAAYHFFCSCQLQNACRLPSDGYTDFIMNKQKTPQMPTETLAKAVKEARREKKWTQGELARKSEVSLRTISLVEKKSHVPGPEAVIRLATALGESPQIWLALAKHDPERHRVSAVARFPGEADPPVYFEGLLQALQTSEQILMCPSYNTAPGALNRPDVFAKIVELVNKGLWLAMTVPYPRATQLPERKTRLMLFYQNVFTHVQGLAEDLRTAVDHDKRERVNLFVPKISTPSGVFPMIAPTLGLGEYRPTFVKFAKTLTDRPTEELGAWFKLAGEEKDRWIPIYPDAGLTAKGAQTIQAFSCWRDYFSDIIEVWEKLVQQNDQKGWRGETNYADWNYVLGVNTTKDAGKPGAKAQ